MEEARTSGAIAFFGEKYGEEVRQVYVMGEHADTEVSRELCGGKPRPRHQLRTARQRRRLFLDGAHLVGEVDGGAVRESRCHGG